MSNSAEEVFLTLYSRNRHVKRQRLAFVKNIQKAIGDLSDPRTPISIKPALQRLLSECHHYLAYGNEHTFAKLCLDAIDVCRQGWTFWSCWLSSSQNICYSIYWALKAALEKHQQEKITTLPRPNLYIPNNTQIGRAQ